MGFPVGPVYENGTLQELAELLSAIEALGDRIRLLPNRLLKEATPNMRMLLMILSVLVVCLGCGNAMQQAVNAVQPTTLAQGGSFNFAGTTWAIQMYRQVGNSFGNGTGQIIFDSSGNVNGDLNFTWLSGPNGGTQQLIRCSTALNGHAFYSGSSGPGQTGPGQLVITETPFSGPCSPDTLTYDLVEANQDHAFAMSGDNPSANPLGGAAAPEISNGSIVSH